MGRMILMLGLWLALLPGSSLAKAKGQNEAGDTKAVASSGIQELYQKPGDLLWYCSSCDDKRLALIDYISRSEALGLDPKRYLGNRETTTNSQLSGNTSQIQKADQDLTKAALAFSRDLYAGADLDKLLSYDEVSPKYASRDMDYLLAAWKGVSSGRDVITLLQRLEPQHTSYQALKKELQRLPPFESSKRKAVVASMNYYRWIQHFEMDSFIVVNIPAAQLQFNKGGKRVLQMRTVVGTPDSKTPRFASHVDEVTLYPYWNMPRSILVNEWLGIFKDNPSLISYYQMELVDSKGAVVSPESINWKAMSIKNFPYRVRQKTGCENPLGVVKFGLSNPFDVYLHDTNVKGAFEGAHRFYSHGCVRIEDPVRLAEAVIPGRVDKRYLNACFSDQKPQVIPVANSVPVFIVYMMAEADESGKVNYYRDIYELMGK